MLTDRFEGSIAQCGPSTIRLKSGEDSSTIPRAAPATHPTRFIPNSMNRRHLSEGEWKFNEDGTVDSSSTGPKSGKWTIDINKKQVLITWGKDLADKSIYRSTPSPRVARRSAETS
jgi:hypothetical protein